MSAFRCDAAVRAIATICAGIVVLLLVVAIGLVPEGNSHDGTVASGNRGTEHCINLKAGPAFQLAAQPNDLTCIFGNPVRPEAVSSALARNRIDVVLFIPVYTIFFVLLFVDGFRENRRQKWCALIITVGVAILDFAETGLQIEIANFLRYGKEVPLSDLNHLFYAARAKLVALGILNIFVCILGWNELAHGRFRLALLPVIFGASGTVLFAFLLWGYGAQWFLAWQNCVMTGWLLAFILAYKKLDDIHISTKS